MPKAPKPFKWIWKSCCLSRKKFFYWPLLLNRLNTYDLMLRNNFFAENSSCVLCDIEPIEDRKHLFFSFDFIQNFSWKQGFEWNTKLSFLDMLAEAKQRINSHVSRKHLLLVVGLSGITKTHIFFRILILIRKDAFRYSKNTSA